MLPELDNRYELIILNSHNVTAVNTGVNLTVVRGKVFWSKNFILEQLLDTSEIFRTQLGIEIARRYEAVTVDTTQFYKKY